jgi:hypothetical protein
MPLINGRRAVKEIVRDGMDSIILETAQTFPYWVEVLSKPPYVGEDVFVWGAPDGLIGTLFKGYRAGELDLIDLGELKHYVTYDMNGFHGISGSGIFNYKGQLVGTLSARPIVTQLDEKNQLAMIMTFMASRPYEFTKEQWKQAGVTPKSRVVKK